ncbi:DUF418 domain-containing protein [Pseudophaeobacter flagellatus]|uniref:DUF418 domain-containing protein n=1 Tax=Pseudophaeobacter flagellatus TaxID=2899119 RepID=UPI001E6067B5|nr:DUF418 domain-containing protein [Pseudophaeobacter flagellatus]MCD9148444.1 DUF418 domain-containing protein [Pseudophaeobacter flagellatus]
MRQNGLDIARFLAYCGMVLVNFRIAAQVTAGPDFASLLTNNLEGRAAALFVVLAGIGLTMGTSRKREILARAGVLFALGLLNLQVFEADILHFYALYFLLALPFVNAAPRHLLAAALGAVVIGLLGLFLLDYEAHWDWNNLSYAEFWTLEGFLRHAFFNGWHPVFPWVSFVFIGMWIGRQDLGQKAVQNRLVLWGGACALLASLPGQMIQVPDLAAVLGTASLPPGPFYILAASGSAALILGLVLRVTPTLDRLGLGEWLAAPGRIALSLYIAHILVGMGTLEALGQLDGSLTPQQILGYSLGFCALSMLVSWLWALIARRGPLESLMRLTTRVFR